MKFGVQLIYEADYTQVFTVFIVGQKLDFSWKHLDFLVWKCFCVFVYTWLEHFMYYNLNDRE